MYHFHQNTQAYFKMQNDNAVEYVLPFIERTTPILPDLEVLEVGCAEGGVLKAFFDRGCKCTGVELEENRAQNAQKLMSDQISTGRMQIITKNIFDPSFEKAFADKFDLIILKDVIEHIHDQQSIMFQFRKFLKPNGKIYFGFPPFRMPFGGHQQMAQSKILSKLPYFHLLPMPLFRGLLKLFGEPEEAFVEIKETGISIARFEEISSNAHFDIIDKIHYLFNPIYKYKFGINAREQYKWITHIPYFRDFLTTCVYYLIEKKPISDSKI